MCAQPSFVLSFSNQIVCQRCPSYACRRRAHQNIQEGFEVPDEVEADEY